MSKNLFGKNVDRNENNTFNARKLTEELLLELNRNQLISKSKKSDKYKTAGRENENRWTRRNKSTIATRVDQYNKIDMNELFKNDELKVGINVHGETNDYVVLIRYNGVLHEVAEQIKRNNNKLEFKCILIALQRVFNNGNVFVSCSCLHPETKIKLLDGTSPTVAELKERFDSGETLWAYSTDENGNFKPGQIKNVWITKTTTDFIETTLDNSEKILTTPEHPFMLRSGEYIQAKDLKENDLLMGEEARSLQVSNVKVCSIENTPVYDLTVDTWGNFLLDAGVVVHNCPDWAYRQAYNASKGGYNSGPLEIRASDITNPGDTKGAGCKHVNLVLGNIDWLMKVTSVINNYIHYMKRFYERKYADLIFPKLFNMPYQKAVQLNLFDTDDSLVNDDDEIKLSNRFGRDRGKFRSDVQVNNMKNFGKEPQIKDNPNQPRLELNLTRKEDEIKKTLQNNKNNAANEMEKNADVKTYNK